MNIKSLFLFLLGLSFCACTSTHQKYIPAPHELPAETTLFNKQTQIPEEQISVRSTQRIKPEVLQTLMKTRGYVYKGYRNVQSEYAPSISDIKKAAHTIGASDAIYFVSDQKTVREQRESIDLGQLVGGLISAKNKTETGHAISRGLKTHKRIEDVTYYNYYITYWSKSSNTSFTALNVSEIELLKKNIKKLKKN